jgi:uncharacterized protein YjbJ (UPF0337 family)
MEVGDLKTKGKMDQGKGKVREMAGKVTGNRKTQAKGKAEQVKGKVKDTVGRATNR